MNFVSTRPEMEKKESKRLCHLLSMLRIFCKHQFPQDDNQNPDRTHHRAVYPQNDAPDLLIRKGVDAANSPSANGVDRIQLVRSKENDGADDNLRRNYGKHHANAGAGRQSDGEYRTGSQDQSPENQSAQKHAPVHHTVETPIDHRRKMNRGQQPETDKHAEQCDGDDRIAQGPGEILNRLPSRHQMKCLPHTWRHARKKDRAWPAQYNQKRPEMMQCKMLKPVNEKLVLGVIIELGVRNEIYQA